MAGAPLAAALALYAGLVLPLRTRGNEARDAYSRARRERQQAQSALAPLERQEAARRDAVAAFAGAAARDGGAVAAVRRSVLATLGGSPATDVHLGVRPDPGGLAVRVRATAPYADGLRLARDLARPSTGLVLQRVRIAPQRDDRRQVGLELEAQTFPVTP
jgi:hypothetical protein